MISVGATLCLATSAAGKKSAWLARQSCPSVTDAFLDLSLQPVDVISDTPEKIERFIVVMYSRKSSASGVNEAMKELFAQCSRTSHKPKRRCCKMCDARHTKQGMCDHI